MLLCQNSRRHKHSYLFSAHNGLKCRTNCNLGFAETNITAKKAVHRNRLFHVLFYIPYGCKLVRGFLVRECILELLLPRCILRICKTRSFSSLCVKLYKVLGNILRRSLCLRLGFCPFRATHFMQARCFTLRTDIFLEKLHLVSWHKELIISAVFYVEIVLLHPSHVQRDYTEIFSYAVIYMYHVIPDTDFTEVGYFTSL